MTGACLTCLVEGCICEWCETCQDDVNPYGHWHVSDLLLRELIEGKP